MENSTQSDPSSLLSCGQFCQLLAGSDPAEWLLIDIRSPRHFRRGHLAGSHSLPAARLLSGEPPEGKLILIGESSQQALAVIEALHAGGYNRSIRALGEGLRGWRARGLPLEAPVAASRPSSAGVLPALVGTGLLLAAAALSSLPLLALGTLLLWEAWLRPSERPRHRDG
ncbi:MAG: rhodanese-like domain-containing protein [Cyanobium sp.]